MNFEFDLDNLVAMAIWTYSPVCNIDKPHAIWLWLVLVEHFKFNFDRLLAIWNEVADEDYPSKLM